MSQNMNSGLYSRNPSEIGIVEERPENEEEEKAPFRSSSFEHPMTVRTYGSVDDEKAQIIKIVPMI